MNKKVCLFGASGHGKVIQEIAENLNIEISVFADDFSHLKILKGVPVKKLDFIDLNDFVFLISIGDNAIRSKIVNQYKFNFISLIDRTAVISKSASIGQGTAIMPSAVINADAIIGNHVIINTGAIIEHDCKIGDFVHISPNATLAGGVIIEQGTHIGANAVVIPSVKIGKWVTVGAGAVIIKDIPDYSVVVGNPGRIIKNKESNER